MRIDRTIAIDPQAQSPIAEASRDRGSLEKKPRDPAKAAREFEEILVRQFVRTMTKDLFKTGLAGEDGAGWVKAQAETQTDTLADVVTKHIVDSGNMNIAELLMAKWESDGSMPDPNMLPQPRSMPLDGSTPPLTLDAFMLGRTDGLLDATKDFWSVDNE